MAQEYLELVSAHPLSQSLSGETYPCKPSNMWKTHHSQIIFPGKQWVFHFVFLVYIGGCPGPKWMWRILEVPTPNLGEGLADQENVVRKLDECRGAGWCIGAFTTSSCLPVTSYKLRWKPSAMYIIYIYIYIYLSIYIYIILYYLYIYISYIYISYIYIYILYIYISIYLSTINPRLRAWWQAITITKGLRRLTPKVWWGWSQPMVLSGSRVLQKFGAKKRQ